MNTKQYFGLLKQISFTKLLNIVVVLSMLLTSCGTPEKRGVDKTTTATIEKAVVQNDYEPPVYTHPEPAMGERPTDQLLTTDASEQTTESPTQEVNQPYNLPINGSEIISTPTPQATPGLPTTISSPMPENNLKKQIDGALQDKASVKAVSRPETSSEPEWILNWNAGYSKTIPDAIALTYETSSYMLRGSSWFAQQIDLNQDFDKTFNLYFGTRNGTFKGGDGIAFVLQNTGTNALGQYGGDLGYGEGTVQSGISPSVAVEFDTYRNTNFNDPGTGYDSNHIALLKNGHMTHNGSLPLVNLSSSLEDGKGHLFRFQWVASTHHFIVSSPNESGEIIWVDYTEDFVQTLFGSNPKVWFGFTGATASATNLQYFEEALPGVSKIYSSEVECNVSCSVSTQNTPAGPINTRTGGYDYITTDISIPSMAGDISFKRTYSSLTTSLYSTNLGYGWTHNHDLYLAFSDYDETTGDRTVTLKGSTGNQYDFTQAAGSTTLRPFNGIYASLTQGVSSFILKDKAQNQYDFDLTNGKLISRTDSDGRKLIYTYDTEGRLTKISDLGSQSYLSFSYSGSETRIASVTDHTGRAITYTYDENNNLVSATDLLAKTWTYQYDDWHHLTQVTDPDGKIVERTEYESNTANARAVRQYDGVGKLVISLTYNADGSTRLSDALGHTSTDYYNYRNIRNRDVDPNGAQTTKRYDKNMRPTTISDAVGNSTTLAWSADGANLTRMVDAKGGRTDIIYNALNNPTSVIDPKNHLTTYEYDGTRLTKVVDATQGETTYTYTPEGYLESVTDGEGVTTSYGYDSLGQRTSMTDELQNTWEYSYDDLGRLVDTTDPLERVAHNEYDVAGRLVRATRNYDPNRSKNADNEWNVVTEYEYDAAGNQTLVRDTLGRETQYKYDDAGRLIKTIDPELHETISEYDEAGRLSVTIDALQHHTYYFYDETGRLKETKNELDGITSTAYNLDGTVKSTTDALNRTTYYTYDDLKRVSVVTQPGGGQTKNTYDELGNLIKVEDSLKHITQYEYDAVGRQIKTIDPDLKETESFYDNAGRLLQTVDARKNHTTYEYDEIGRLEKVIDQLGGTNTYEYDEAGRRAAVIDANQNRTHYTYDQLDRVTAVTNTTGTVYTEYDVTGQVLSRTDANGNKSEFTYTVLGQLETQKDAEGGTTTFGYDALGNRISVQDANLHTTLMEYDELNRLVKTIDPSLSETKTEYDAAGQVVITSDPNNQNMIYEYNELGLQTKVIDQLQHEIQYTYNTAGQMTSLRDANGIVTAYEYDALGRLSAVIENFHAAVQPTAEINVRTDYTYDENGNRLTIKDGNGHVTNFTYDELNRLTGESDPLGNSWSYDYDVLGNRISMTDANGNTTNYAYDDTQRLTGVDSAGTEADVSFNYDAGGRRTGMTDAIGTTTWNYDDLNRPTTITDPFEKTVGYAYDAVGNRTGLIYSGKQVNYAYDPSNRLTTVQDQNNDTNYQYDVLGRVVNILRPNGVNTNYSYDVAGRLVQLNHATDGGELASYQYTYDAAGNRIQAVENVPTSIGPTVRLTVADSSGNLLSGREVYAFNGETYTGYHKTTDTHGQVNITLPAGDFRFRVEVDGTQFWSGTENHCTIGKCSNLLVTIPTPITVVVTDSDGNLRSDIPVYAYIGNQYTGHHGTTNAEGTLMLRLPEGDYRFRADWNGTQFWSQDTCVVPTCATIPITVTLPVTVTVLDNVEMPHAGVEVYAFSGTTYTGKHAATDENGQVQMTLSPGDYRFRADFNGTQFWSEAENHCTVSDCREARISITLPLIVTVMNTDGFPQQGIPVYAFNGTTYTNFNGKTDVDGRVNFTLPVGSYRFRADLNGTQFWSDTQNHCTVPDCTGAQITLTSSTTITVTDTENAPKAGVSVYAFNDTTYTGHQGTTDASGQVNLTLPQGSYRFRADYNGTQFWSGSSNHCDIPGCSSASVTVTNSVLVTVQDTDGTAKVGLKVYVFDGSTYTGYNGATDTNGQVALTLPQGSYRFRADYNNTQFWSESANHCDVPGCSSASVTVTNGILVTVNDTSGAVKAGIPVYAFNGTTYTGYSSTTNADGQVTFTLPLGSYRFRANYNNTQFWSGASNHCDIPGCVSASVTVTNGILVTVQDTDGSAKAGLKVYAFNGATFAGYSSMTNADGQVTFTLPLGSYRFRADLNGTQFWSGASNHCIIPNCGNASVTVTNPTTVIVQTADGMPQSGVKVYAFNGITYTGYSTTTNANGQGVFTLPQGNFRFRANYNNTQYWSNLGNHCAVPGCTQLTMIVGPQPTAIVTGLPTASATPMQTETSPTLTPISTPTGTELPTPETTATETPVPTETQVSRLPAGNVFAVSFARPESFKLLPSKADTYNSVSVDEFDSASLDSVWSWVEPLAGPSWSLTNDPGFFQFTMPPGYDHWEGVDTAPSLRRTDMGTDDFAIETNVNLTTENPGDGYKYGLMVGFSETDRLWMGIVGDGQVKIQRTGIVDSTISFATLPVFLRVEKVGTEYTFLYKQNAGDDWTNLASYTASPAVSYVGIYGSTFAANSDVTFNTDYFRLERTTSSDVTVTVSNTDGVPQEGSRVYVFNNNSYIGINNITDANGQVTLALPDGNYRFRTDLNGVQFWSGVSNHCEVPGCHEAAITVSTQYNSVSVDEFDSSTLDPAWDWAEPLAGPSWSLTNNPGSFQFTVPPSYDHWEGVNTAPSLQRTDMGTGDFAIETSVNLATDNPGDGYKFGLMVGFSETDRLWMGIVGDGQVKFQRTGIVDSTISFATLPVFLRVEKVGTEYTFLYKQNTEDDWVSLASYTASPTVSYVGIYGSTFAAESDVTFNTDYFRLERTASPEVTVTVSNTGGVPQEGMRVYAFDNNTYKELDGITDTNGKVTLTLPHGNYRFRADLNGAQFWSGASNHCEVPGCKEARIIVSRQYDRVILDEFDSATLDTTWTWTEPLTGPSWSLTNNPGSFQFTVPAGNNDEEYHTAPSLQRTDMDNGDFAIETSYSIEGDSGSNWYESGLMMGFSETDRVWFGFTGYRQLTIYHNTDSFVIKSRINSAVPIFLRIEKNGAEYTFMYKQNLADAWIRYEETFTNSAPVSYVGIFGDNADSTDDLIYNVDYFRLGNMISSANVTTTVLNTDGAPQAGLKVYVFDYSPSAPVYTGFSGITDAGGHISLNLPVGSYRFRADINGTQFWNDEADQCRVPGCDQVEITVTKPVTVTVRDSTSASKEGLNVYAFDDEGYTGYHAVTNASGQATITLPQGSYRFRADYNGTQFWSSTENNCSLPGCENAAVTVSLPVTVTVLDTDSTPKASLNVYAFNETTYSGYNVTANSNGQAVFTLPFGTYRFRADLNGTQFWSGNTNHCDPNAVCEAPVITVTKPVSVSLLDAAGSPYPNLPVYAFDGTTYTGYHGTTNSKGQVTLTLQQGNYHFRADLNGTQFWNNTENNCTLPGCENATIILPGGLAQSEVTIDYTYDPLYRLTTADYSNGDGYTYTYDSVGNRLTQESTVNGLSSTVTYNYDIANRLADVDGVPYVYDDNGNLLNDGTNEYTYDPANRLSSVISDQSVVTSYQYNGLGDRLSQTVDGIPTNYTLDLNAGLTQVLSDGTTSYTYGVGRISQQNGSTPEYFLGDALGSVRQLTSQSGKVTLAKSYDPYGVVTNIGGASQTDYGFTGESLGDSTQLIYLRARYYNPTDGKFQSRDTWGGDQNRPLSFNRWNYVEANPINRTDPSGLCSASGWGDSSGLFTQTNCNNLDNDLRNGTTSFTDSWYRQLAARERADGLPQAADALEYYLNGKGSERSLPSSFVKDTIEVAMPKIKDKIDNLVAWYIKKNFAALANCNSFNTGPDIYYGGRFTPDYYGVGLGYAPEQTEAAATLGTFKVYVELSGVLDKVPGKLWGYTANSQLNVHVTIFDFFNWNPGQDVRYPASLSGNQIWDNWADNLEKHGTAKSYINRGDYIYPDTQSGVWGPGLFFNPNKPPGNWSSVSCIGEGFDKDGEGPRRKDYCGNQLP